MKMWLNKMIILQILALSATLPDTSFLHAYDRLIIRHDYISLIYGRRLQEGKCNYSYMVFYNEYLMGLLMTFLPYREIRVNRKIIREDMV